MEPSEGEMMVLSYGAGVQSTAMLLLVKQGKINADVAVFSDTQDEPQWVYDTLEDAKKWTPIPIETVTAGRLSGGWGGEKRFAPIPAFCGNGTGMLRRQCTREFKIAPIERFFRKKTKKMTLLLGITVDEARRMKPNRRKWITNEWPLIEMGLGRQQCKKIIEEAGLRVPLKSSCVYCPFHSDHFWLMLKRDHPKEWEKAVDADNRIRNMGMKVEETMFLHRQLVPLNEVDLQESQLDMFNECGGYCGL